MRYERLGFRSGDLLMEKLTELGVFLRNCKASFWSKLPADMAHDRKLDAWAEYEFRLRAAWAEMLGGDE